MLAAKTLVPIRNFSVLTHLSYILQQVVKKNILSYRSTTIGEKPISAFSSTTSLGPLQTQQVLGPGQKFQQHQKFNKKSKDDEDEMQRVKKAKGW